MSQGDDGALKGPADPNKQPGPPPNVAPPRPGTAGGANRRPPVPTAAKPPPPPQDAKPSAADEEWLEPDGAEDAVEEVEQASPAPATREAEVDDAAAPAAAAPPEPPPPPARPPPPPRPPTPAAPFSPPAPITPSAAFTPSAPTAKVEWPELPPIPEEAKPASAGGSESMPAPSPFQKRSRGKVIAFILVPALVLVGGGVFYQTQMNGRSAKVERAAPSSSAETTAEPPAPTTVPLPPPTFAPETPPSASAPKKPAAGTGAAGAGVAAAAALSADPSKTGIVDTSSLPPGRKIIVDGRMYGTSPRRVVVPCGSHRFTIGDQPPETIALPCGGEINFTE